MADQKASTLCGADGHSASQCQWNAPGALESIQLPKHGTTIALDEVLAGYLPDDRESVREVIEAYADIQARKAVMLFSGGASAQSSPTPELERFAPVMRGTTACMEQVVAGGYVRTRDHIRALQTARAAQAGRVPEGWKSVPIEPTKEMMLNGSSCQHHDHDDMSCIQRQMRRGIWSKMLAAAPAQGEV